jgi:hypothetical protein
MHFSGVSGIEAEAGNPGKCWSKWIPAFAGMTKKNLNIEFKDTFYQCFVFLLAKIKIQG